MPSITTFLNQYVIHSKTKTEGYHNLSVKIQFQFAQMVVALLSVTKAEMEGHPDNIDRSCLKKLMRLPRFLLTTTYYVGSITILVTVFRMNFVFILWLYFLNNSLLYFHVFPSVSFLRDSCNIKLVHVLLYNIFVRYFGMISQ